MRKNLIFEGCCTALITPFDEKGNKFQVRGREELAIAFQHELDHLNGILFFDHIDKKNPFKDKDLYRAI